MSNRTWMYCPVPARVSRNSLSVILALYQPAGIVSKLSSCGSWSTLNPWPRLPMLLFIISLLLGVDSKLDCDARWARLGRDCRHQRLGDGWIRCPPRPHVDAGAPRSEERRVGKECRGRRGAEYRQRRTE